MRNLKKIRRRASKLPAPGPWPSFGNQTRKNGPPTPNSSRPCRNYFGSSEDPGQAPAAHTQANRVDPRELAGARIVLDCAGKAKRRRRFRADGINAKAQRREGQKTFGILKPTPAPLRLCVFALNFYAVTAARWQKRACRRGGRSHSGTSHENAFGQGEN